MSSESPPIAPRPKALSALMAVPAVFALLLVVSTIVLGYLMYRGGKANGAKVSMVFIGECAVAAQTVIQSRATDIGLAELKFRSTSDQLEVTARLPGNENDLEHIPRVLSQSGVFQMRDAEGEVLLDQSHVKSVSLRLDQGGMPEAILEIDKIVQQEVQEKLDQRQDGFSELWLDGELINRRPNTIKMADDFRLVTNDIAPQNRMQRAVDFGILLRNGIHPCSLKLTSLTQLSDASESLDQ